MTMVAIFAALGMMQVLSKTELVVEGEAVGRLGEAIQICGRQGYPVDELVAEDPANRFARRAMAAGWSRDVVEGVVEAGVAAERATMPFSEPLYDLPADELHYHADNLAGQVRVYCHALADRQPAAITDLESGDREVAVRLATARRAAADILSRQ